jgi:hypothetical protein
MEMRADMLRRRVALYRDYLSKGVESGMARQYLRAIAEAEAELTKLREREQRVPPQTAP